MTDDRPGEPGSQRGDEPEPVAPLDAGTEAAVRRLLGDARATGPPPPEVAARLDAALAALERGEDPGDAGLPGAGTTGGPGRVVPLRRRRVRQALIAAGAVAAAATIAVPIGLAITGPHGESALSTADEASQDASADTSTGASTEDAAPEAGAASRPPASGEEPKGLSRDEGSAPLADPESGAEPGAAAQPGRELLLSRQDFDDQVAALVERGGRGPAPARRCGAPGAGRQIAVRYDGALGTLLLSRGTDVVRARLYVCGQAGVARDLEIPAG